MKYLPLIGSFLFILPSIGGTTQFSCPQKGTVTIWKVKNTVNGEILCVKRKLQFKGVIALPDPQKGEVYTLECKSKKEVK